MDIGDTEQEAAFRAIAAEWLAEHAPTHAAKGPHSQLGDHVAASMQWERILFDHGWAGVTWPVEHGGRGGTPIQASIFAEEMATHDVTLGPLTVSIGMVGPTLMAHGTDEQKARHLGPVLRGEQLWCQLFSEPGAGSDLAALATRAVRDGDDWIINGQKVWTSLGQFADYGILLARTDPDVPKHAGITYFIVDMRSPGIDVRPLRQMTGEAHFNETFLTDVRIPSCNVVGELGDGWSVARTTLNSERSSIASGGGAWNVAELLQLARENGASADPILRDGLIKAHIRQSVMTYTGYRVKTAMSRGALPGPEALTMKLAYARHWAATMDTAMRVLGADALLTTKETAASWHHHLLNQYAIRLGGGTDEVQSNIIGELGLGLPREPSADRGVAWKDLRR